MKINWRNEMLWFWVYVGVICWWAGGKPVHQHSDRVRYRVRINGEVLTYVFPATQSVTTAVCHWDVRAARSVVVFYTNTISRMPLVWVDKFQNLRRE